MPSLKDLKTRINSVKSTQKITSAMKMVAAAKLRRAQEQAEAARPYAKRIETVLAPLAASMAGMEGLSPLLVGNGRDVVHLVVVMTSDRGLCGAFNSSIVRQARRTIRFLQDSGKNVKILCVGRKGRDQLRRDYAGAIVETIEDLGRPRLNFDAADKVTHRILQMFENGEFDFCHLIYNQFKSAITQIVTVRQLIPFAASEQDSAQGKSAAGAEQYEYEPEEGAILFDLLLRNVGTQIYRALLENAASEQGARMTAMDNATRNAGDMINRLTITYNRSRQAYITKELIEIISGAEAL